MKRNFAQKGCVVVPVAAPPKPTKVEEFNGNPVVIPNSVGDKQFQGLKVYGKSTQVSNQLLPLTQPTYTGGGLTGTVQGDGSIIVNGTPESDVVNVFYIPLTLSPGTYYISGGEKVSGAVVAFVSVTSSSGTAYYANQSFRVFGNETSIVAMLQSADTQPINNYRVEVMLNARSSPLPLQSYTPTPESPVPIVSAGEGGSIALSITDGAEQSQSLTLSTPSGLPGIPVDGGGNYTDASGQQLASDYWDFGDGQQHILCGEIASYNGEEITTPYISSTGALTTGAQVLYVLPEPRTEPIPAETMAAYRALQTYENTTVVSTIEPIAGLTVKAEIYDPQPVVLSAKSEELFKIQPCSF